MVESGVRTATGVNSYCVLWLRLADLANFGRIGRARTEVEI